MPEPAVEAAVRVADWLAKRAEETDMAPIVPEENLRRLADEGMFGIAGPESHGGAELPGRVQRAIMRAIGGACGNTYFVWAQHHGVVRLLADSTNETARERWLAPLCRGTALAGTAFAHVRRQGPPAVTATRVDGGWRLNGEAPWATSWGLARIYAVAAVSNSDELVWAIVPGEETDRLRPSAPLPLAAMGSTSTVRLRFDSLVVPQSAIAAVQSLEHWRRTDAGMAARLNPAVIGLLDRGLALLREESRDAADSLRLEVGACSTRNEELASHLDAGDPDVAALADARAWGLELLRRMSTALLAATGGHAMERTHPAQRIMREAAFYVVQAQSDAGRAATLRRVTTR